VETIKRSWKIGGFILAGLGLVSLAAGLFLEQVLNLALPLVFLMLAVLFGILAFNLSEKWLWAVWLFLPAGLLLAFGVIFLLNVLTGDWNAWAYAWLLLVAGLGAGLVLAGWYGQLRQEFMMAGVGLGVLGITFFAIFGVIAGGPVIKVAAPLLLLGGGITLSRLSPAAILPERILKRLWPAGRLQASAHEPPAPAAAPPVQTEALVEPLSARELEVLRLIDAGLSNMQIAERLSVAPSTVKTHINNIYGKMAVQTRVQAIHRARELKLL
jgi:DNA-binding CsgD family transcriptional regulator